MRGATWPERMRWCQTRLDPGADAGIIVLEQGGFRPMSGRNTMCAVTALLETGSLPAAEPQSTHALTLRRCSAQ